MSAQVGGVVPQALWTTAAGLPHSKEQRHKIANARVLTPHE